MNKSFRKFIDRIKKFRDERDWMQFHNPKNMAISISVEANELLEHFQWRNFKESEQFAIKNKGEIARELADILAYILELADNLDIDLEKAMGTKQQENTKKYPIKKARGKHTKYNKL